MPIELTPQELTPEELAALKDKKILVVEDDPLLQNLLVGKMTQFRETGLKMFSAFNAEKAFELARTEKPDLILLDLILPGMSGFEFLTELRKDPASAEIPVIVLSNLNEDQDKDKVKELGIIKYFVKANFSLETIAKEVAGLLMKRP